MPCAGVKTSPVINAKVNGITALSELMGDTTPMRPVDNPAYKQINPIYPVTPASAPATKYPPSPKAFGRSEPNRSPFNNTNVIPNNKPTD